MKFFGVIFAVIAVASAKNLGLGSQVQTRSVTSKDEFATAIWSVGQKECDPADGYLAGIFDKMGDPMISERYQPIIDSHIYFHNLGSNVAGLFYQPWNDASSKQPLYDAFNKVFMKVSEAVSFAKERGVVGADDLTSRRNKCNSLWDKARGDLAEIVTLEKADKMLDVISVDALNDILAYFQFAASLMNDSVIALSKQLPASN